MKIGLISGSGFYDFTELEKKAELAWTNRFGKVVLVEGLYSGHTIYFVSRHGAGHKILSNHINHRANILALKELAVDCVIAATITGIVDPNIALGQLILFHDLYFPDNRLPNGELCSMFNEIAAKDRGHLLWGQPFPASLRKQIIKIAVEKNIPLLDNGIYSHVNGPRFNTASEIKALRAAGVAAISQTSGPEVVLAAEMRIPYQLIGFGVDYANGVKPNPTPIEELNANMAKSQKSFKNLILKVVEKIEKPTFDQGFVYTFE